MIAFLYVCVMIKIIGIGTGMAIFDKDFNFSFVNPFVIYENVNVNWFGAVLLTIGANLLFPVISVCYWFYKLCTVGRKD